MNDGEGQALALREGTAFFHRSAGACPPRSLHGEGLNDGEGQALALRRRGPFFTVARGPVPRERSRARDRPSRYVKGSVFFAEAMAKTGTRPMGNAQLPLRHILHARGIGFRRRHRLG